MEQRGAALSVDYATEPLTYYTMAGGCWWLSMVLSKGVRQGWDFLCLDHVDAIVSQESGKLAHARRV